MQGKIKFTNTIRETIILGFIGLKNIKFFYSLSKKDNITINSYHLDIFSLIIKLIPDTKIKINQKIQSLSIFPGKMKMTNGIVARVLSRGLSYYLEFIIYLILVKNQHFDILMKGRRNFPTDLFLERVAYVNLPIIRKFSGCNIRIRIFDGLVSHSQDLNVLLTNSSKIKYNGYQNTKTSFLQNLSILTISGENNFDSKYGIANFIKRKKKKSRVKIKTYNLCISRKFDNFCNLLLIGEDANGNLISRQISEKTPTDSIVLLQTKIEKSLHSIDKNISTGCTTDPNLEPLVLVFSLVSKKFSLSNFLVEKLTLHTVILLRNIKSFFGAWFKLFRNEKSGIINISGPFF